MAEFDVYKSTEVELEWVSVADLYPDGSLKENKSTQFIQGNLGDCWLVAAIESLRYNNEDAFSRVVRNGQTFLFWERGDYTKEITLDSDAVPATDGAPVFMKCVGGTNVYWGLLLEKAFAKWFGSYEGLEGGFWSVALQAFTGGVIERIKMRDRPDDLFNYMLECYQNGSSLCCIIKKDEEEDIRERYHTLCCLRVEGDSSKIMVRDPSNEDDTECHEVSYEEFTQKYHRLDICHRNVSNLSKLRGRKVGRGDWVEKILNLHEGSNTLSIELTDPDDDADDGNPKCTFVVEVVRAVSVEGGQINPWRSMEIFSLSIADEVQSIKFPQETFIFSFLPGKYNIEVENTPANVYLRVFSKKNHDVHEIIAESAASAMD